MLCTVAVWCLSNTLNLLLLNNRETLASLETGAEPISYEVEAVLPDHTFLSAECDLSRQVVATERFDFTMKCWVLPKIRWSLKMGVFSYGNNLCLFTCVHIWFWNSCILSIKIPLGTHWGTEVLLILSFASLHLYRKMAENRTLHVTDQHDQGFQFW